LIRILTFSIVLSSLVLTNSDASLVNSYYKDINHLKGFKLKSKLKDIIKNHSDRGYSALIKAYMESDKDLTYDGDNSIVSMYSENPHSNDSYVFNKAKQVCGMYKKESDCFNREHIVPQSSFNRKSPMRNDIFHVYPADGHVNGKRSSYPFGEVDKASWTSENGSKVGYHKGEYTGKVFEPIDEFKGDIARSLFYFATRYEESVHRFDHPMFDKSNDRVFEKWVVELLTKWHELDPVSSHEKRRNNYAYKYQGNRNPYIDHPELVELIW
jgi:endonuclease I